MNIGIVVPYFTPYVRGNEYGLAQSLADLGHSVTIVASNSRSSTRWHPRNDTSEDTKTQSRGERGPETTQ